MRVFGQRQGYVPLGIGKKRGLCRPWPFARAGSQQTEVGARMLADFGILMECPQCRGPHHVPPDVRAAWAAGVLMRADRRRDGLKARA